MKRGSFGSTGKVSAAAEVVSRWCQCENAGCNKWRRLPPGTEVDDSKPWFCYMNPDELRNSCEAPEESYNEDVEEDAALLTDDEVSEPATGVSAASGRPGSGRGRGAKGKRGGRGRGRGHGRGRGRSSKTDTASSPPWPSAGKRARVKEEDEEEHEEFMQGPKKRRTMSLSDRAPDIPRADHEYAGKESPEDLQQLQWTGQGQQPQPHSAAPLARGTAKARKAHKGFEKLLSAAGVWEVAKGKGRAVLVPPQWIWEGFAQFAPDAAEVACNALDMLSAARYFELPGPGNAPAKSSVDEVQTAARLAVMMASAAAADSAAGSLAASAPPTAPAAAPQSAAFLSPTLSHSLTAPVSQSPLTPVLPPMTTSMRPSPGYMTPTLAPPAPRFPAPYPPPSMAASGQAMTPPLTALTSRSPVALPAGSAPSAGGSPLMAPGHLSSLAFPSAGLPSSGQQGMPVRLPVHSAGPGLHGAMVHPSSQPGSSVNGMVSPVHFRPAAGTVPQPPVASAGLLPLPAAAQAASQAAPALPVPSGPHSGVHWRADGDPRAVAGAMQQPASSSVSSSQQRLHADQAPPGKMHGQQQPTSLASAAAPGSGTVESRLLGSSHPAHDVSSLGRSKPAVGSAAEVTRPQKQQHTMQSNGLVNGKAETHGASITHPTAVNGIAHEPEKRPRTLINS